MIERKATARFRLGGRKRAFIGYGTPCEVKKRGECLRQDCSEIMWTVFDARHVFCGSYCGINVKNIRPFHVSAKKGIGQIRLNERRNI